MKRAAITVLLLIGLAIGVGVVQLLNEQKNEQNKAKADRDMVSADLRQLYAILKGRKDQSGRLPQAWQDIQSDIPHLNHPITEYELHPGAAKFEPLIIYKGTKVRAQGYNVLGNGVVTNGRVKMSEERRL